MLIASRRSNPPFPLVHRGLTDAVAFSEFDAASGSAQHANAPLALRRLSSLDPGGPTARLNHITVTQASFAPRGLQWDTLIAGLPSARPTLRDDVNRKTLGDRLNTAERYVRDLEQLVRNQRAVIGDLLVLGKSTDRAIQQLRSYEESKKLHSTARDRLRRQVDSTTRARGREAP